MFQRLENARVQAIAHMLYSGQAFDEVDSNDFIARQDNARTKFRERCREFADSIADSKEYYSNLSENEKEILLDMFTGSLSSSIYDLQVLFCEYGIKSGFSLALELDLPDSKIKQRSGIARSDFYSFYQPFIVPILKNLMYPEYDIENSNPVEQIAFSERFKMQRTKLKEAVKLFVQEAKDNPPSDDFTLERLFEKTDYAFNEMLELYFEAGFQSGSLFILDMGVAKDKRLSPELINLVKCNHSIVRQLLSEEKTDLA